MVYKSTMLEAITTSVKHNLTAGASDWIYSVYSVRRDLANLINFSSSEHIAPLTWVEFVTFYELVFQQGTYNPSHILVIQFPNKVIP